MTRDGEYDSDAQGFRDRLHEFMFRRVIGEPVWAYVVWITICVVLAAAIIYSIQSGSVPCPDPTSGC